MLQPAAIERSQQAGRGLVIQVTVAARNARLQRLRVIPVHQQVEVVVAFEHQRIAAGEHGFDMAGGGAGIGEHAQTMRAIGKHEVRGLARVVWHGKRQ